MNIFFNNKTTTPLYKKIINATLIALLIGLTIWLSLKQIDATFDFSFIPQMKSRILSGFLMTFYLSVASLVLSLAIGIIGAFGQSSPFLLFRYFCVAYVKFIRGTPLIMQIYLFFYIIATAWGIDNRFIAGVLILSIFEGAYIAEIIRGSLISIDEGQLEAAKAVGFSKSQTMRNVILPQLIARTLPGLTGQFASIIKDSSLLSIIAVIELTQTMREISAMNFRLIESYLFLGVLYLCLTLPITFFSSALERKYKYGN